MRGAKPAMFIGSSVEGKAIAETIQLALEYDVHTTVWHQGIFGLSGGTLESLVAAVDDYDFATLVLTADDLLEKRQVSGRGPRDNVLFELGLFMGALGRNRTFIVHSRTTPPMLPTDLAGITPATYEERSNLVAALGPACTKIKHAIESQGVRPKLTDTASAPSEMASIHKTLAAQTAILRELFKTLTEKRESSPSTLVPDNLDFLDGAWLSTPPGSHAYCRVTSGMPRIVYCYAGDSEAIGEYRDLKRFGDEIIGRFRWFDGGIQGFVWLKIESPTRLSGAWWMDKDVPNIDSPDPTLLRKAKGMNPYVWEKQESVVFPKWAMLALLRQR